MDNQYSFNTNDETGVETTDINQEIKAKRGGKKPAKNRGLDSLRGIAVIVALIALLFWNVFKGGTLIFNMFYVVLGYITTVTAVSLMRKDRYNVPEFYIKRIKTYYLEVIVLLFAFCGLSTIFAHACTKHIGREIMDFVLGFTVFFLVFPLLFFIWNKIADKSGPMASNIFLAIVIAVDAIASIFINESIINIYPYLIGMLAALIYKKKLKYSGLPQDYKRNRMFIFIVASVLVLVGEIFYTGSTALSRLGVVEVTVAMGVMVWYATATYLKIGSVLDRGFLKALGKMWLEFNISFIACTYIFIYKDWVNVPGRIILAIVILALTYILYKVVHFISVASIKESVARSNIGGDVTKTVLKLLPLIVLGVLMIVGFIGLIVSASSSDDKEKKEKKETPTEATTEATTTEAPTTQATTEATTEAPKAVDSSKVTIIGDFILEGAQDHILEEMPEIYIDSNQNRQVYDGSYVAKDLAEAGNLRDVVVIELGTNGPFEQETGQEFIDAIGKNKRIYWINIYASNRDYEQSVNETIQKLADANENVNVIDWNKAVKDNPDYVHDGFYLTEEGLEALAKLINTSAK
ncbi:MAG: hypothetical protein IJJ74_10410 [Eubacterium sp.]|nr:hypothetical protein [Eubacterium sp.]